MAANSSNDPSSPISIADTSYITHREMLACMDTLRAETENKVMQSGNKFAESINKRNEGYEKTVQEIKSSLHWGKFQIFLTIAGAALTSIATVMGILLVADQSQESAFSAGYGSQKTIQEDIKKSSSETDKRLSEIERLLKEIKAGG